MIKWIFQKFLCPHSIHKIESVMIPANDAPKESSRRFYGGHKCKYCTAYFISDRKSYSECQYEETLIHGRNPFKINFIAAKE